MLIVDTHTVRGFLYSGPGFAHQEPACQVDTFARDIAHRGLTGHVFELPDEVWNGHG